MKVFAGREMTTSGIVPSLEASPWSSHGALVVAFSSGTFQHFGGACVRRGRASMVCCLHCGVLLSPLVWACRYKVRAARCEVRQCWAMMTCCNHLPGVVVYAVSSVVWWRWLLFIIKLFITPVVRLAVTLHDGLSLWDCWSVFFGSCSGLVIWAVVFGFFSWFSSNKPCGCKVFGPGFPINWINSILLKGITPCSLWRGFYKKIKFQWRYVTIWFWWKYVKFSLLFLTYILYVTNVFPIC